MVPHIPLTPDDAPRMPFPTLPIITPDPPPPPRRTEREKYGGMFTLGWVGLVVVVALVGWFASAAWSLRGVWSNIYVLHDARRSEAARVHAAEVLGHDPRVNQRQLWDICLRTTLPARARYVVAEALTAEAATADPHAYGLAVARSEGWPDWLRLLLLRPIAYAASAGDEVDRPALRELARHSDPIIDLWAEYALAVAGDEEARATLEREAGRHGPTRALASDLMSALQAPAAGRPYWLDRATVWLRTGHPEAAALWDDSGGRVNDPKG